MKVGFRFPCPPATLLAAVLAVLPCLRAGAAGRYATPQQIVAKAARAVAEK